MRKIALTIDLQTSRRSVETFTKSNPHVTNSSWVRYSAGLPVLDLSILQQLNRSRHMQILKAVFTIAIAIVCTTIARADTYYVSPTGSDANTGTSETKPFQMVQYGVDKMKAGDTLVVLDGIYTGTLKLKSGITIRAKNPRKAIFSGAEPLQGDFQQHSGNIYKIDVGSQPKQVFYKDQPMTWARWPNMTWAENWNRGKKWAGGSANFGTLKHKAFAQMKDLDLAGAYCFLRFAKGNSCYSRAVKGFDGDTLLWDDTNFYNRLFTGEDGKRGRMAIAGGAKGVRGTFFLAGALDLLDSPGEWFAKDGTLYFYAADGQKPDASDFLIKTNDYSVYQTDAISDVTIEGVDFLATSVKLASPDNQQIAFRNVHFSYIGAEPLFVDTPKGKKNSKPIDVSGSKIAIRKLPLRRCPQQCSQSRGFIA